MQLGFSCIFISTHTSRVGCDAENISKKEDMEFLLTHPVWDVTAVTIQYSYLAKISTHTSRVGCDLFGLFSVATAIYFYSHIPCGMWLLRLYHLLVEMYFYSHIPCGMWLFLRKYWYAGDKFLLTHPVWDVTTLCPLLRSSTMNFYSHIPCGMWLAFSIPSVVITKFLLTHPVWDVTSLISSNIGNSSNFYSHIPCGMWRTCNPAGPKHWFNFYSHIPCGMWPPSFGDSAGTANFYSHIPCGMWLE